MKTTLVAATAALFLTFGAAGAQTGEQHRHGQGVAATQEAGMHGGMGAGMAMQRPSPARLLAVAEVLGLDTEQVTRLEAIDSAFHADHHEPMHMAMEAESRAQEALHAAAPDLDAYRAALEEAAGYRVTAQVVEARASVDALAVLTEEQTQTLHRSLHLAHRMMGGGMGMGGGSGMHGGMGGGMHGGMGGGMHGGMGGGTMTGGGSGGH